MADLDIGTQLIIRHSHRGAWELFLIRLVSTRQTPALEQRYNNSLAVIVQQPPCRVAWIATCDYSELYDVQAGDQTGTTATVVAWQAEAVCVLQTLRVTKPV
ncbi:MAG: hypothetical protein QF918_02090 [Pirellulaceae bacterium]|nr:hypothetical protein [Pirellulaceae bacterium]